MLTFANKLLILRQNEEEFVFRMVVAQLKTLKS